MDGLVPGTRTIPASTKLSGSYTYEHAKLGVFEGIAGTLSSQGKFSGTVGHIDAEGNFDVPDFKVSGSAHEIHLASNFHAVVDGTNGDTLSHPRRIAFRKNHGDFAGRRKRPSGRSTEKR